MLANDGDCNALLGGKSDNFPLIWILGGAPYNCPFKQPLFQNLCVMALVRSGMYQISTVCMQCGIALH